MWCSVRAITRHQESKRLSSTSLLVSIQILVWKPSLTVCYAAQLIAGPYVPWFFTALGVLIVCPKWASSTWDKLMIESVRCHSSHHRSSSIIQNLLWNFNGSSVSSISNVNSMNLNCHRFCSGHVSSVLTAIALIGGILLQGETQHHIKSPSRMIDVNTVTKLNPFQVTLCGRFTRMNMSGAQCANENCPCPWSAGWPFSCCWVLWQ